MKKHYKMLILFFVVFHITGCGDKWLDKKPSNDITKEDVFKTYRDANKFLTNVYSSLDQTYADRGNNFLGMNTITGASDDGEDNIQGAISNTLFNTGSITSSTAFVKTWYNNYYVKIRKANLFLESVDMVEDSGPEKIAQMKAEAKFLRSFFYFHLFKWYGPFTIVNKVIKPDEPMMFARNTVDECVQFMLNDLDEAIAVLPNEFPRNEYGRVTRLAALALKTRLLLYYASPLHNPSNESAKWKNAADAASVIIQVSNTNNGSPQGTNYPSLFRKTSTTSWRGRESQISAYSNLFFLTAAENNEIIFSHQTAGYLDYLYRPNSLIGWGGQSATAQMVDSYEMSNGMAITDPGSGYDPQKPHLNRDPRFYATVLYNGETLRGATLEFFEGGGDLSGTDPNRTGFAFKKYLYPGRDENIGDASDSKHQYIYFRYAEVLLNYAEALNEASGVSGEVYSAINQIRNRAGMPDLQAGLSQNEMREKIRNERRIELAFEDHRYFDVRRWKIAEATQKLIYRYRIVNNNGTIRYSKELMETRPWDNKSYYLPIPQDEINKNNLLIQNPGY